MGTYGAQLTKERGKVSATRTAELFFEKVEVDDDVRYRVFVYLVDSSICEEVLYPCHQPQSLSLKVYVKEGRTMRHWAIYAVAARYASSLYDSLICSESTTVVSQLTSS